MDPRQEWPIREGPKRPPRRREKYGPGTQMTVLLNIVADPNLTHVAAVEAVIGAYPSLEQHRGVTSGYVYNAQRAVRNGDIGKNLNLTRKFIADVHPSGPPLPPQPSLWQRLWPWLAWVWAPTALLLTGVEIWR